MNASVFKQVDLRYLANTLAQEQTHAGISTFELGLGLDTEGKGSKAEQAKIILRDIFARSDADELIVQMLNFVYVEDAYANTSSANTVYATLKFNVLDPRGVLLTDDGFRIEGADSASIDVKNLLAVEYKQVGEGSYANVFRYVDPNYGTSFAVKRLKQNSSASDIHRFKQEFATLQSLRFPYIVEVFKFDESGLSYTMEYCDETLGKFIDRNNQSLERLVRKRIALQFLYGLNYLHRKGICHRDLSVGNILVKNYDLGAVMVKLSDFGLSKHPDSEFTRGTTAIHGTIVDPGLESFKDFSEIHDIYAVGPILWFIFTGKRNVTGDGSELAAIVAKCMAIDTSQRYPNVLSVIQDIDSLDAVPRGTSA